MLRHVAKLEAGNGTNEGRLSPPARGLGFNRRPAFNAPGVGHHRPDVEAEHGMGRSARRQWSTRPTCPSRRGPTAVAAGAGFEGDARDARRCGVDGGTGAEGFNNLSRRGRWKNHALHGA